MGPVGKFMLGTALVLGTALPAISRTKATIAIKQIVEHLELDNVRRGVVDAVRDVGYTSANLDIVIENAQGDIATEVQIARRLILLSPNVIISIPTSSKQVLARTTTAISIIFGAFGDPVGPSLVTHLAYPGSNVSGVASFTPVEPLLNTLKAILPDPS